MGLLNFVVFKIGALHRGCVLLWPFVSRICFILAATIIKRMNMPFRYIVEVKAI